MAMSRDEYLSITWDTISSDLDIENEALSDVSDESWFARMTDRAEVSFVQSRDTCGISKKDMPNPVSGYDLVMRWIGEVSES